MQEFRGSCISGYYEPKYMGLLLNATKLLVGYCILEWDMYGKNRVIKNCRGGETML